MKKRKPPKNRNAAAKALESPLFRHKVVPDKREKEEQRRLEQDAKNHGDDTGSNGCRPSKQKESSNDPAN